MQPRQLPVTDNVAEARQWIARTCNVVSWDGDEAKFRCPLPEHADTTPSAGANAARRAWHCHGCGAGGTLTDLANALGIEPPRWNGGNGNGTRGDVSWRYHDRAGKPLVEVVKYYKAGDPKRRTAIRHRPEWHPTLTPKKPANWYGWSPCYPDIGGGLLYHVKALHDADAAARVLVVEGEKDVDRLRSLGFTATCNFNGGGKWHKFHTERMPAGRDVVILADADLPGVKHADTVATALQNGYRGNGKAASVRIVTPAQLGFPVTKDHGKDISDWLDADSTRGAADVQALIDAAELVTAPEPLPAVTDGAESRPDKGGIDAGEAAMLLAPSMAGRFMFATGRGWFCRASEAALWRPADDATMLDRLQRTATWWTCKRGTRTSAILSELTGPLRVDGALLDADDWTCGLPDGRVLDLRTGTVRAAVEADRITMALRAVPEPGDPLVWLKVLRDTFAYMDEPEAVLAYFRWWIRHSLTGDCSAQRMAFLHGQSGTGKNTVADALLFMVDDYGQAIPAVHVVGKRDSHRAWIAQCDRKRFVLVGDLPPNGSWSAELHDMVGGADLNANFMRQNHFTFRSRAHVLATGNDAPRGQAGIWRRLAQYECRNMPTKPDTALKEKLQAEAGRILQWAIDAPIQEPTMPVELRLAAEAVRDEQDPVRAWIRETWKGDPLGLTVSTAMFERYHMRFTAVPDREQLTENAFGRLLTGEFGPAVRKPVDGLKVRIRRCVEV